MSGKSSLTVSPTKTIKDRRGPPPVTHVSEETQRALEEIERVGSWKELVILCKEQDRRRRRRETPRLRFLEDMMDWNDESAENSVNE
jgi:hypothetical protein